MAIGSFRKFKTDFRKFKIQNLKSNRLGGKFPAQHPGRLGSRLGSRHPRDQVDFAVDLGVDLVWSARV